MFNLFKRKESKFAAPFVVLTVLGRMFQLEVGKDIERRLAADELEECIAHQMTIELDPNVDSDKEILYGKFKLVMEGNI